MGKRDLPPTNRRASEWKDSLEILKRRADLMEKDESELDEVLVEEGLPIDGSKEEKVKILVERGYATTDDEEEVNPKEAKDSATLNLPVTNVEETRQLQAQERDRMRKIRDGRAPAPVAESTILTEQSAPTVTPEVKKEDKEGQLAQVEKQKVEAQIAANLKNIKERIEARERESIRERRTEDAGKRDMAGKSKEVQPTGPQNERVPGINDVAIKIESGREDLSPADRNLLATNREAVFKRVEELKDSRKRAIELRDRIEARSGGSNIASSQTRTEKKEQMPQPAVASAQPKENIIPVNIKAPASAPINPAEENIYIFNEAEKKKIKSLAERLFFEGEGTKMSPEEKKFYEDPMNKSAIHRERTRISKHETKFEDAVQGATEKSGARERMIGAEAAKEKIKDRRVLGAIDKMKLDLSYVYNVSPGFFDLDPDKQLYVLEKTRQKVSQDATFEAKARVEKDLSRKPESVRDWFKKRIQSFTQEFQETKARKQVIEEAKGNGMLNYAGDVALMTDHVNKLEVPISYDKDGKLSIEYVRADFFPKDMTYEKRFKKGETMEEYVKLFNEAATALSEIPQEWALSKFTWNKKRYNEALNTYETRKSILLGAVLEKYKQEIPDEKQAEAAAMMWMNNIDTDITTNQILTEHPDLDKRDEKGFSFDLDDLDPTDTKMKWGLSTMGVVAGGVGRMLTRKNLGFEAAAVFGGALGGLLAGRKKWLEYTDKEKKKRYGAAGIDDKGIKKFLDAEPHIDKLQFLIDRFDLETDEMKKAELGAMLRNRASALDARIREGRVNYGSKDDDLANKLKIRQLIAEANTKAFSAGAFNDVAQTEDFYKRLGGIQRDARRKWINRGGNIAWASIKGAAKSAGGALVGFLIVDGIREFGSGQSYINRLKEIWYEGGEGKWNDVPEGIQPHNPGLRSDSIPVVEAPAVEAIAEPATVETAEVPSPVFDDSPDDLDLQLEDEIGDEALADNIESAAPAPEKFELPANIKDNLKFSADGEILDLKDPLDFESAKKFSQNSGNFLNDMKDSNLPSNFQNRSWGMGALSRVAPDAEKFLAWQEVLEELPADSSQAETVRAKMIKLGDGIREELAEFAKDKSGVDTTGNFFKPYEDFIGRSEVAAPGLDATASLDGIGITPEPEPEIIQETVSAPEIAEVPEPVAVKEEIIPEAPKEVVEKLNEDVLKRYNGENPVLDFGDDNGGVRGQLEFVKYNGKILEVIDFDFQTDTGLEFRNDTSKFISTGDLDKFGFGKGEAVDDFERYLNLDKALEVSGLPDDSPEALAIQEEMAEIDAKFVDKTRISVESRLEAIENGEGIESLVSPDEIKFITTGDKIPVGSMLISDAEAIYGKPLWPPTGNIEAFKDGNFGVYAEGMDAAATQEKLLASARANGLVGKRLYEKAVQLDNGSFRLFYVFKK